MRPGVPVMSDTKHRKTTVMEGEIKKGHIENKTMYLGLLKCTYYCIIQ